MSFSLVSVYEEHTGRMAIAWLVALMAAASTVVLVDAAPGIRVAAAFAVGEAVAVAGLTVAVRMKALRAAR